LLGCLLVAFHLPLASRVLSFLFETKTRSRFRNNVSAGAQRERNVLTKYFLKWFKMIIYRHVCLNGLRALASTQSCQDPNLKRTQNLCLIFSAQAKR